LPQGLGLFIQGGKIMPVFNFELFVDVEADDFESAYSWLRSMPLEKQLDFHVIDYFQRQIEE
jgi:hypothetical protein